MKPNKVFFALAVIFTFFFLPVSGQSLTYDLSLGEYAVQIMGESAGDGSGRVLAKGDVNGDGYEDIIVGASMAARFDRSRAGVVYIVFGGMNFPVNPDIDLVSEADVLIYGALAGDRLGEALGAGDVNGDGIDDIIIGAPAAHTPDGLSPTGKFYVIFGRASFPPFFDLAVDSPEVIIVGENLVGYPHYGIAVATGDINGDGTQDIICGSPGLDHSLRSQAGKVHVIFGGPALTGTIHLSSSADLTICGANAHDYLGSSLASGNINGDGFDDIIMVAGGADPLGRADAGRAYVIFGGGPFVSPIDLGFTPADITILGDHPMDYLGSSVACGDLNGDRIDDLAAGAWAAKCTSAGRRICGKVYVFYGSASFSSPYTIDLHTSSADITVYGSQIYGRLGYALALGDVDGDGKEDLLMGSYGTDSMAGSIYGICGSTTLPSTIDLAFAYDIAILGDQPHDNLGVALASGDLDGDMIGDIIGGAFRADPNGRIDAGKTYVIKGVEKVRPTISATIVIEPDSVNLKKPSKHLKCYIELPAGYSVEDIDIPSVALTKVNGDVLDLPLYVVGPSEIADHDKDDIPDVMVKFDTQELIPLLEVGDSELTVSGEVIDGPLFEGTDIVRAHY
ncbi:MAG: hypothetical protein ACYTBV_03630 [Planctomycetota bacterium]|jgi:hypothetical protein